ncbi:TonB-dependent siderophore receptor [Pelomonas sp. SE-A7]|uniref:TonB-dependent receptor n=1 Tax=Pelomonas sp. SE-A7 TaxID=3054953 RepID=UPI00259CF328|nr:TonB-dependent siderophore receptor [Pelomonas sp. SE-A7]MDM4767342.1 TonB-dependent siderophore receptor [Pelomonas sp. SE-A7]
MQHKTLAPIPTGLTLSALMLAPAIGAEAPSAVADPADPPRPADNKLQKVTVEGQREAELSSVKQTKPLLDTPQTALVIPAALMRDQAATNLVQVLKNSPGISMQAGEGGSGGAPGDSLSIRGFNARKDIFVDGVRDFGSYSRDPFNLEQVEMIKGPSSAFGGRGSTGGLINLVTKQPQKENLMAATAGGGSGAYRRLTLDFNQWLGATESGGAGLLNDAALRVNAMAFEADTPGRDHVRNQRSGIAPSLTLGLGTPDQLSIALFHLKQDNMPDFGIPFVPLANNNVAAVAGYGNKIAPVPFSNFYGLLNRDHEFISTHIGSLNYRHEFGNGMVLRDHAQYGSTYRDSIISAPRFSSATSANINHELQTLDEKDTSWINQTDLTLKLQSGSVTQTLVMGAEFGYETSGNYARGAYNPGTSPATVAPLAAAAFPTTDLFHPDATQAYVYSVLRTGAYAYVAAHSQAVYLFDTVDFDPRWSLTAGLRWDRFHADAKAISTTFTGNVLSRLGRTDSMLSWRGSLAYKPSEKSNLYLSAGSSFNPSAEALTLANAANSANSSNLSPEKSRAIELGGKWEIGEKLLLSAALFRIDKTNARTEDPANPNDFITLNGKQRMQGLELGAVGRLDKDWSMSTGYAYLRGKILSSANPLEVGQPLSSAPRQSASLWIGRAGASPWSFSGGLTHVGSRVVNTTNTRQIGGYTTVDAMAAYRVSGHFTLRLNAYNLGDKPHVLDMYNTGSSGHVIPGPGRSVALHGEFSY